MNVQHEKFDSGWLGISMSLSRDEIDDLIGCLQQLKAGSIGHFHLTRHDWSGEHGIADVEISLIGEVDKNNMQVG